jgi:hypothetical protein
MKQDDITAHLMLRLAAAELAISALQLASEPARQERAFRLLETLHSSSSVDNADMNVLHLARANLSPPPGDGGT